MAIKIKEMSEIKENYRESIPEASRRYKTGVSKTSGVIEAALKGQKNYEDQMNNPDVLKRREAGLRKTSDEEWRRASLNKGSKRIGEGMRDAVDKQASGYAPYRDVVAGLDLPDKTTDVDANIERVRIVAKAQHDKKLQLLGEA